MKRIFKKLLILFVILFSIFSISCSHEHVWDEGEIIKEANCIESGLKIFHCSCGVTREEVIAITLHTEVIDEGKEPTCTEPGLTEGSHCSVCGTILREQLIFGTGNHIEVVDPAKEPTCTSLGLTEGSHCSVCNEVIVPQMEYGELLEHNFVDKVCTMCGSTDFYTIGLIYGLNTDGTGYVVNGGANNLKEIVIPSTYKGLPVVEIGKGAFYNYYWLENIVIPETVTVISDTAFFNCDSLSKIELPNKLVTIGANAFETCDGLNNITIPASVTSIGKYAFNDCHYLTSIVVKEGNTVYDSRNNCNAIIETATNKLVFGCPNTAIPNDIEVIAQFAFTNYNEFTTVIIPTSVKVIEAFAFQGCSALVNIYYFGSQTEWEAINIDNSNNDIFYTTGTITFNYLHTCNEVIDPEVKPTCTETGLTEGKHCSICNKTIIAQTEVPALGHTEVIDALVEATCAKSGLTEGKHCGVCNDILVAQIEIPATGNHTVVVDPAKDATCTETGLTEGSHCGVCNKELVAQTEIAALGHNYEATYNWIETECEITLTCTKDTTHIIKEKMTVIENVLVSPTCLEKGSAEYTATFTLGDVTYTDKTTLELEKLGHLVEVDEEIKATCTATGLTAGSHCGRCNLVFVEQEVVEKVECKFIDGKCEVCGSTDFYTENLLFTLNETGTAYKVSKGTCTDDVIVIPSNYKGLPVTVIDDNGFKDCTKVTNITIGENVIQIGENAFSNCSSLITMIVPNSVTVIGFSAFSGCSSLVTINLPFIGNELNGNENTHLSYIFGALTYYESETYMPTSLVDVILTGSIVISDYAFANCASLEIIALSESIKEVGAWAFANCTSLEDLILFNNIEKIGESAFSGCRTLADVNYRGTIEDWCKISFTNEYANPMYPAENFYIIDSSNNLTLVKKVEIPSTVYNVGNYQFYGFDTITTVKLAEGVSKVGAYAFYDCKALTSITLPGSLEEYETKAFRNTNIANIYYDGTIEDWCKLPLSNDESLVAKMQNFYILDNNNQYYILKNLEIPSTVKSIGGLQFYGFKQLESIIIREGVAEIGNYAFANCSNVKDIKVPNSIKTIGQLAFYNCKALTYNTYENGLYLGNDNNGYVVLINVVDKTANQLNINNNTKVLYYQALYNCNSLTSLELPNNLTNIGDYAFYGCTSLKSIKMPNSVMYIGTSAFYNCNSLESIDLPDNITTIEYATFAGCTSLTDVEIPNGVTKIDNSAFSGCTSLVSVDIPNTVTEINNYAFNGCSLLESIIIPSSVTYLGEYAFSNCEKLVDIYYDGTLEDWCNFTFENEDYNPMTNASRFFIKNESNDYVEVTEIVIPDSITEIGDYQFAGFKNVTSIKLPNSVTSIGKGAFSNCTSLEVIEFGNGIKNIGEKAFAACTSLVEVKLPDSLETIAKGVFEGCTLTSITLPFIGQSIDDYEYDYFGHIFGAVNYQSNYDKVPASLKEVVITNCNEIPEYAFYRLETIENIELPDTLTYVGQDAFYECNGLEYNIYENGLYLGNESNQYLVLISVIDTLVTEFNIHEDTKVIYTNALASCYNIQNIVVSNNVTNIGFGAFKSCYGLRNITIPFVGETIDPKDNGYLGYIFGAESSFYNSYYAPTYLVSVTITGDVKTIGYNAFEDLNTLKTIILPDTVEVIKSVAFENCTGLQSITLPASLKLLESSTFSGCSNLVDVYYNGTLEDWCNIEIEYFSSTPMLYAEHIYMLDEENEYIEVTEIVIPESVTEIADYQFLGFNNVTNLFIHNGVTKVGVEAFSDCTSLETITFDDSYTEIANDAFTDCTSLIELNLGKNIISIGNRAFYNCNSLTTLVVPNSVEYIGNESFYNGYSGSYSLESITLPFIGRTADDTEYDYFGHIFGDVYLIPDTLKEIIITSGTIIPDYAFNGCSSVETIILPSDITSIGEKAFNGCSSITSFVVPETVEIIGKSAFNGCNSLENITIPFVGNKLNGVINNTFGFIFGGDSYIPTTLKEVTITGGVTIGAEAFRQCNSLESVIINGVTTIGTNAFSSSKGLKTVTLGIDITNIDFNAFYGCTSLANVNYFGTLEQWNNITIASGNEPLLNAIFKYNFHYHIAAVDKAVEPTCTKTGLTEGSHCSICNEVLVAQVEVPALGHKEVIDEAVDPTCEKTGLTEGSHCGICNEVIVAQTEVEMIEHTYTDYVCDVCGYNYYTEGLEFTINENGTAYKVSKGTIIDSEVIIPGIYNNLPVESINTDAFANCDFIKNIIIPNTIIEISYSAFYGCTGLESITIPFTGNKLNGSVDTHFGYIFGASSYSSQSLDIPSSLTEVIITNVEVINERAFYGCKNLTNIVLPKSITTIETQAFYNCKALTNFIVPNTVMSIGEGAFRGCEGLESITLPFIGNKLNESENTYFGYIFGAYNYSYNSSFVPVNLKEVIITVNGKVNDFGFYGCENIEKIVGVTSFGNNAFSNCNNLKEVYFNGTLKDWCELTFTSELESPAYSASHIYMLNDNNEYYEFTELVIPEGVTEIGNYQFYGFSNVTNIIVPNSVTRIGFSAFRGCDVLESITLPFVGNTLDGDANNHFKYVFGAFNSSDTSVVLPETLKEVVITNATVIGYSAFDDCNLITTITLLESVKTIESLAFSGCSSLVTVNMTDNITSIGSFAFKNCTSLETIKLPASIEILKSELFANCTSLTKVEIPEGVKKIEFRAFSGCNSLETLVIPSTVTSIEYNALEGLNSIKSLTIPFVGQNADGSGAFNFGCIFGGSNDTYVPITLKEVIISNTTVIESYSFFGCNNIESVVILEGTTKINSIAFANCNSLKSITLPSSLESIGSESFINCPLENVYYMGTVEQWNNITIDQHETTIVNTNITYNYVIEE